jgi:N-acetylglucosaminyl-diphospho-decaprenol L-rhamnosyltransferase
MPDLAIIIVSFNTRSDLERCLASLHEPSPSVSHEIIVVDNGSTDGSGDAARRWSDVRLIETGANLGFARANNMGIRASTGEYLLLLNSDTIVPPRAVDLLLDELKRDRTAVVVGPRLVGPDGRAELSFGSMIGPFNELRQKVLVRGLEKGVGPISASVERMTRKPGFPDWVSGACLMVRRQETVAVGLLDERYFMYAEDVDFCAAIRARGGRVKFVPSVTVVHHRGRSGASARRQTEAVYRRSQMAFYDKHHPRWAPIVRLYQRLRGAATEERAGKAGQAGE